MIEKNKESVPLIYILAVPILLIISTCMAHIHFNILGSPFYISVCIYPLTYFITLSVLKKANVRIAMNNMAISLIFQALVFITMWVLLHSLDCYLMVSTFISFFIGQLIIIIVYEFLTNVNKDTYLPIFILLLVVSIVDNVIYGNLIEGRIIGLSILIRLIYVVILTAIIAKKK